MVKANEIGNAVEELFNVSKQDAIIGPIELKITMKGNGELIEEDIQKQCINAAIDEGFHLSSLQVIYDEDGFTRIIVKAYDNATIISHIRNLEKRDQVRSNPRQMLNAFNKAIIIADDFNNQFGEGKHNKTVELNEIQEIFELMKD